MDCEFVVLLFGVVVDCECVLPVVDLYGFGCLWYFEVYGCFGID